MRPLTLRMSGLRSYRSEVTVDFGDPGLIAIVGDTGAGKSSILEALFFVLYGGCTWDHRATVPLISDGATVMQVELVFLAEGRRWKVFRSASRTSAQSRNQLECLDDPALRFDNDGPVTTEVKRLIGLDPDAFLRTVILPQGRFQMLLRATRTDRTAILKGIFRLDQLAKAREQADSAARRIRPRAEDLKDERATLLPDPEAALADARQRHNQARSRQAELQVLSEIITAAAQQHVNADRQASDLQQNQRQVQDTAITNADADLATLAVTASQLQGQRRQLEARREERRRNADSLAGILTSADQQGDGIKALARAASTVEFLTEQLPNLHAEEGAFEQEALDLATLAETINAKDAEAASLKTQTAAARTEEGRLATAATAASELLTKARTELATARNCAAIYSGRQKAVKDAAQRKSKAAAAIEPAATAVGAATQRLYASKDALETIQRANSAAHAAEGCEPGDPCPVCQRSLPAGFAMPAPAGDAEARAKLKTADQAAKQAIKDHAAREADLITASDTLERSSEDAEEAGTALGDALIELRLVVQDATLDVADENLLAPLASASDDATEALKAQSEKANQLAQRAEGATATIEALRQQAEQESTRLSDRQVAVRKRKTSYETAASELPVGYRADAPLTADALRAVSQRIADRQSKLDEIDRQLADARGGIDQIARELENLNDQLRTQVDEPAGQLIVNLSVAEQRLNDLAALLGAPPAPDRPDGGLASDAQWARALKTATNEVLTQTQDLISRLQQQRAESISAISDALAAAQVDDEPGLQQAIIDVSADLRRADNDIRIASGQIPHVAELARKIELAQGLLEALDEITRLLSDNKFVAHVVTRKQQTLLAVATELLGSMTGNRYGFSKEFEIVDRLTGLPRGVKTLSGGETFLASLALALGMVELAGRGGGRLEALFLDEGFGALDANSLSEALDALGRQAETGRLVAVISHLRSVAEAMDRVLAVTAGPSGSQARWLGIEERDELTAEDLEARLLT